MALAKELTLKRSRRLLLFLTLSAFAVQPLAAQFGPFSVTRTKPESPPPPQTSQQAATANAGDSGCKSPKKKKGAALFGAIVGNIAGNVVVRTGAMRFIPVSQFSTTISEAIACRLDPDEQQKAATATDEALRTEKIGRSAEWSSDTRQNVTGTSTVTTKVAAENGTKCMMVTDVIIVDGEETRAEKKMCKGPGEKRYVLLA